MQRLILEGPERNQGPGQLSPDVPHPILQYWLRVVKSYTSRKSTLPSDKLPALSALAVSYAPIFGPEYFAGIWTRSAVQQLCWRVEDSRKFFTQPTRYRAPSWSWAALDGPVFFPSFLQKNNTSVCVPYHRFKIVEWQARPKAVNLPYGEVTDGKLIVTTVLRAATFSPSSSPTIKFDAAPCLDLHDLKVFPSIADTELMQTAEGISDTVEDNFTRPVRCLAMYHKNGPGSSQLGGLILAESSEHNGLFRRMGSFSADVSAFNGYPLDTVSII